ncbi:unnamed protein product [Fraxinus pennsylvanica]|uniref:Uncharacterized protein n=1 Tax=Fraxinus pennsylvanica TaxID=56036 RepID=A0AAD2E6Y2_9LAMI|nr:unnamed protein product [Fraxinus pennsylvanica]
MHDSALQAVMEAGTLLQTLLLAGSPLQWRHPLPPLDTYQIPQSPVVIPAPPLKPIHQESLHNIIATSNINNWDMILILPLSQSVKQLVCIVKVIFRTIYIFQLS